MIDAKELRIGNWLWDEVLKRYLQVSPRQLLSIAENQKEKTFWQPIPLSPEILEKCGFVGRDNKAAWVSLDIKKDNMVSERGFYRLVAGRTASESGLPYHIGIEQKSGDGMSIETFLSIREKGHPITLENCNIDITHDVWIGTISYVHQLQNLYYALTGKEINIEL